MKYVMFTRSLNKYMNVLIGISEKLLNVNIGNYLSNKDCFWGKMLFTCGSYVPGIRGILI